MTPLNLLIRLTGLSQREAGDYLGISVSSVEKMVRGANPTPDGIIEEMRGLYASQRRGADEAIRTMNDLASPDDIIALRLAADDAEARSAPFGWPCVGAHEGMLALVVAECPGKRFIIL